MVFSFFFDTRTFRISTWFMDFVKIYDTLHDDDDDGMFKMDAIKVCLKDLSSLVRRQSNRREGKTI